MQQMSRFVGIVILFCLAVLSGCSGAYYASGARDATGRRVGAWSVFHDAKGSLLGKGSFVDDLPDGPWILWDTHGIKVAELRFSHGVLDGKYTLYYGYNSKAGGRLKTVGHRRDLIPNGTFERYLRNGELLVKYEAGDTGVTRVLFGSLQEARSQVQADFYLLKMYIEAITEGL